MLWGLMLTATACKEKAPPDLVKGAKVIGSWLRPRNLSRSAFFVGIPDGKPSQFVSYIFSEMGTAEWSPSEGSGEFSEDEIKAMKQTGLALTPVGVAFVPLKPDKSKGRQIVVKSDDSRGMVIAEGYTDPSKKPVLIKEWKLQKVEPAIGIAEMYRSNSEMGISNQAF